MHHYQRRRASITGLMLEIRESMKTGRLIGVAVSRLVEQSRIAAMFLCGVEMGEVSGHSLRYHAKKTTHSLRLFGIRITAVS